MCGQISSYTIEFGITAGRIENKVNNLVFEDGVGAI
jgi:hypothetical protein